MRVHNKYILLCSVAAFTLGLTGQAYAGPEEAIVVGGSANISQSGTKTDIHQHSNKAILDWRSFDVGAQEHVEFHQPSSNAMALNRIRDTKPSQIDGKLTANGHIMLINPNGVVFGATSQVDVGSLTATTADIDNDDFMAGRLNFNKAGKLDAAIINEGSITAKEAGLVNLVAPRVENHGIIAAKLGKVQLAAADTFTLDMAGDGLIQVAVSDEDARKLAYNSGTIAAGGGLVTMTAGRARNIVDSLVDNSGVIEAVSMQKQGGRIILGGADSNLTINRGVLDASGRKGNAQGGQIEVLGQHVVIENGSLIDASGTAQTPVNAVQLGTSSLTVDKSVRTEAAFLADERRGGGSIKIGGDYLGTGDTTRAQTLYVGQNTLTLNDGLIHGDGGRTIFWSDGTTNFAGNVLARGGTESGHGGFLETSGKINLKATGFADLTARHEDFDKGTYLLDPANITIYGNFDPTDVAGLEVWLDASDLSTVELTYSTDALGGATASGTMGTNTITISADVSAHLEVGARIRLGAQGAIETADKLGADTYTITNIAGTTINVAETLTSNYVAETLRRGLVREVTDKASGNNALQTVESDMALWTSSYRNGRGSLYFDGRSDGAGDYYDLGSSLDPQMVFVNLNSDDTAIRTVLTTKFQGFPWSFRQSSGVWRAPNSSTDVNDWSNSTGFGWRNGSGADLSVVANTPFLVAMTKGTVDPTKTFRYFGASEFGASRYYKGFVPEVLFYDSVLSPEQRHLIEQYQGARYNIEMVPPGAGANEAERAMDPTNGFGAFTTDYLERLSATADIVLHADNTITLDLQGDDLILADDRSISLTTANGNITDVSAGTIRTNRTGSGGNISITAGTGGNITLDTTNLEALGGGVVNLDAGGDIDLVQASSLNISQAIGNDVYIETTGATSDISGAAAIISRTGNITLDAGRDLDLRNSGLVSNNGNMTLNAARDVYLSNWLNAGTGAIVAEATQDLFIIPNTVLNTGLVGRWNFDEGAGVTALDTLGNNNGAITDALWSADTPFGFGTSLDFDGTNDFVDFGNSADFDFGSTFTLSAWAKKDVAGHNGAVISKWTTGAGNNNSYLIFAGQDSANQRYATIIQESDNSPAPAINSAQNIGTTEWVHLTTVADGTDLIFYIDGVEDGRIAYDGSVKTTTKNLLIGKLREEDGVYSFNGKIDNVRVYNTGLSAANVGLLGIPQMDWASGSTSLTAGRDISFDAGTVINASDSGNAIVVNADRNFVNNAGAGVLNTSDVNGRFLVYSSDPGANTLGGLTSDFKRYNRTYAGYAPASVTESGNGLLYSIAPTIIYAVSDDSVEYGDAYTATPTLNYVSGLIDGDALGSIGLSGTANGVNTYTVGNDVGTYANALTATTGTLTNDLRYQFAFQSSDLTVTPATLEVFADDLSFTSGSPLPVTYRFTGFKNGENEGSAGISGDPVPASLGLLASLGAGTYNMTVDVSSLNATNYDFTSGLPEGILTILAAQQDNTALPNTVQKLIVTPQKQLAVNGYSVGIRNSSSFDRSSQSESAEQEDETTVTRRRPSNETQNVATPIDPDIIQIEQSIIEFYDLCFYNIKYCQ